MPARSSAACGAWTGLLAMPFQSTRAKVSPLQTRKRSGSSMITFNGQILLTWPYQEWSISASFRWVVCPQEEGSCGAGTLTEQQLRKAIQRKLVAYKRQDAAKGLRFNLKVISLNSRRPSRTAVRRATMSCTGFTSQSTHNSLVLTG